MSRNPTRLRTIRSQTKNIITMCRSHYYSVFCWIRTEKKKTNITSNVWSDVDARNLIYRGKWEREKHSKLYFQKSRVIWFKEEEKKTIIIFLFDGVCKINNPYKLESVENLFMVYLIISATKRIIGFLFEIREIIVLIIRWSSFVIMFLISANCEMT